MAKNILAQLAIITILSACQGTALGEKLRVSAIGPDEFSVMAAPNLTIPTEFALPQPVTEQDIVDNDQASHQAAALFSSEKTTTTSIKTHDLPSAGEDMLLKKIDEHNPGLDQVNTESSEKKPTGVKSFFEKFNIFGKPKSPLSKDSTLNPGADKDKRNYQGKTAAILHSMESVDKNNSRICDIKDGSMKACEDFTFIKQFPIDLQNNNQPEIIK
jgi:hypothetical protein